MSAIRFVAREKGQFSAELRNRVQRYFKENNISTKGDRRVLIKAGVLLSMFVLPAPILAFIALPAWGYVLLAIVQGIGGAGVGMCLMHDSLHGSFSKKSWVNDMLGHSMHVLGGSVFTWKVQHNLLHHTYTNILGHDEDIRSRSILRFSSSSPLHPMQRYQHIYALFLYPFGALMMMIKDFAQLKTYRDDGTIAKQKTTYRKELWTIIGTKTAHLLFFLVLPITLGPLTVLQGVAYYIGMQMVLSLMMSVVFQFAHVVEDIEHPEPNEAGVIENEWTIHQIATTANFCHRNPIITWYTGGLNYQVEHHLFPNICHVHYPVLSDIVKQTAEEYGVTYIRNGGLLETLGSHLRQLRRLGRPDEYPELPELQPAPERAKAQAAEPVLA